MALHSVAELILNSPRFYQCAHYNAESVHLLLADHPQGGKKAPFLLSVIILRYRTSASQTVQ
jgi:hypothetical protein